MGPRSVCLSILSDHLIVVKEIFKPSAYLFRREYRAIDKKPKI